MTLLWVIIIHLLLIKIMYLALFIYFGWFTTYDKVSCLAHNSWPLFAIDLPMQKIKNHISWLYDGFKTIHLTYFSEENLELHDLQYKLPKSKSALLKRKRQRQVTMYTNILTSRYVQFMWIIVKRLTRIAVWVASRKFTYFMNYMMK